ncbi:hypothetical protein DFH28DRAFT_1119030 [Melampsora americana]|nr:hypothetical protein DFH28DRAFT_1119030 [Melampsora americana]
MRYSSRGSQYGGSVASSYGYPYSGGGYDLGGVWRPHTGGSEVVFDNYPDYHGDVDMAYCQPGFMPAYDPMLLGDYYHSPTDYYGSYESLAMYEQQLRMLNISQAERLARWNSRLQFEELCEEERALRYRMMAEEERIRLGLLGSSYWGSRYGGYGYGGYPISGTMSSWGTSRLPLSTGLASRYRPRYGSGMRGVGYGYGNRSLCGSAYRPASVISDYGGGGRLGITTGSVASNVLQAQLDEAKRLRRHAREYARQSRRQLACY